MKILQGREKNDCRELRVWECEIISVVVICIIRDYSCSTLSIYRETL